MKDSLVLQNVSPLRTATQILNALECKDKVRQIDMNFHEIPDQGFWYGEAHLQFNNEEDLSEVENKSYNIRGVPVTFARGNFDGRHYKSACESMMSDCSDVLSSLSSSLAEMKTNEILFVKNLKRNYSKAFELKKYFSRFGKVRSISLHFEKDQKRGYSLIELDCVESKVAAIASNKNPWLCKSKVSVEKFPGDQSISEDKVSTSPDKVSNFNLERSFTIESGKPFEIRVDLNSLPAKHITFKRSCTPLDGVNEEVFVEIVA